MDLSKSVETIDLEVGVAVRNILYYVESWGMGGIESFLMSTIRSLDPEKYTFDILSIHDRTNVFDNEIERLGGRRFCLFPQEKPSQVVRLFAGLKEFRRLLNLKQYDIVHINTMNGMGFAYSWIAERAGVPTRIVHSHNSDVGSTFKHLKRLISYFGSLLFSSSATSRIACSNAAGLFLFGEMPFHIVRNGIDVNKFAYDSIKRNRIREQLGVASDEVLIGNISRISAAKNPIFQLQIFKEYLKLDSSAKYLMADQGEMASEVDEWIEKHGLRKNVVRFTPCQECEGYYSAMDAMCFPSLFEGLPLVLVEAQCAGLPICMSENVSKEAVVNSSCEILSLDLAPDEWALHIYRNVGKRIPNAECASAIERSGFSLNTSLLDLFRVYEGSLLGKNGL